MAISFDEVDDYYSISDDASLTLPDGDWCIGVWTRVDNNAGTAFQYLLSNNNYSANNSFNLLLIEGGGGDGGKWVIATEDGDGTFVEILSSSNPGEDGKNRLIVAQRDATASEIQLWFCEAGGSASKEIQTSDANFAAVNGGAWNIGRRVDGQAARYYGSIAGEFFKGNFALTSDEITALGGGLPIWALGKTLDVYLPMASAEATLRDIVGGNDATRNSVPTTVEHFPLFAPWWAKVGVAVAAAPAAGLSVGGLMQMGLGR